MKRIAGFLAVLVLAVAAATFLASLACWAVQRHAGPAQWAPPTAYWGRRFWWSVLAGAAVVIVAVVVVLVVARKRRIAVLVMAAAALWAISIVLWATSSRATAVSFGWSVRVVGSPGPAISGVVLRSDGSGYCYINKGRADGVAVGTPFNIQDATNPTAPTKARIEVVSIGPASTSMCRINWIRPGADIRQRDLANTPLIHPGRLLRLHFHLTEPGASLRIGVFNGWIDVPSRTGSRHYLAGRAPGSREQPDILVMDDPDRTGPMISSEAAREQEADRARSAAVGIPAISMSQLLESLGDDDASEQPARASSKVMEERRISLQSRQGAIVISIRDVPTGIAGGHVLLWGPAAPSPTPTPAPGASPGVGRSFQKLPWFSTEDVKRPSPLGSRFGYNRSRSFVVPYWMIAAVLAIPPVASVLRKTGFWHRSPPGHCPACGYDLRASRGRCPECGRPIANDATEPAAPLAETAA